MRLIDADVLMASLGITSMDCQHCAWVSKPGWTCSRGSDFEDACCAIEDAPTVEPERKRGRFVETEFYGCADGNPVFLFYEWQCSECGCVFEDEKPTYNFCPNCGADMREEQNGE